MADYCEPVPAVNADGWGPYNYRDARKRSELRNVETNHFNSNVENLVKGMSSSVGGDIGYTLHRFPNHHRALRALVRLGQKSRSEKPAGLRFPISCYLERAVQYAPDDAIPKLVYALHLHKAGKLAQARQMLVEAEALAPSNANLQYNLGLLLMDLKDYDQALVHAWKAYELGFQLPGLRDRLKRAGKWSDAPAQKPEPPDQPPAAPPQAPEAQASQPAAQTSQGADKQ